MFDSIGWGEVLVLALAALFIFGPEKLPHITKDAAAGLKKVRAAISGMREQMNESLGEDMPDLRTLDLRQYHPKTFIRDQLFGDDDDPRPAYTVGATAAASGIPSPRPRNHATPPPFDPDAT